MCTRGSHRTQGLEDVVIPLLRDCHVGYSVLKDVVPFAHNRDVPCVEKCYVMSCQYFGTKQPNKGSKSAVWVLRGLPIESRAWLG